MITDCARPIYLASQRMFVPCGRCAKCRSKLRSSWSLRLMHERDYSDGAVFVTLTYNDQHLRHTESGRETLSKRDHQLFMKALRKRFPDRTLKYYVAGEYGGINDRPHLHYIIFNLCLSDLGRLTYHYDRYRHKWTKSSELIDSVWRAGYNTVDVADTEAVCRYVAGYVCKKITGQPALDAYGDAQSPFGLGSQGLGLKYAMDHQQELRENLYIQSGKYKKPVPRYYRKKLNITYQDYLAKGVMQERLINSRDVYNAQLVKPSVPAYVPARMVVDKLFTNPKVNPLEYYYLENLNVSVSESFVGFCSERGRLACRELEFKQQSWNPKIQYLRLYSTNRRIA